MRKCICCEMELPLSAFTKHSRGRDGLTGNCKACEAERISLWKHNMTSLEKEQYAQAQGGCPLCGRTEPSGKGWVVDHDRSCCPGDRSCEKCRRGVLCHWCNSALGYAGDDPARLRRMADYLESGVRIQIERSVDGVSQLTPTDGHNGRTDGDAPSSPLTISPVRYAHARQGRFIDGGTP